MDVTIALNNEGKERKDTPLSAHVFVILLAEVR
jgi:hypothetical protein